MNLPALGLAILAAILLIALSYRRKKSPAILRSIEAFNHLNKSIGLAVEDGSRMHISLGRGNLFTARGGSALAGLAMLRKLAEHTSVSDRPPVATAGDPSLALFAQDSLQAGYRAAGADEQYRHETGRLAGFTPFSYAAGALPITRDENVATNILIGNFGAEVALLAEASDRENAFLLAASDEPAAQAVLYASAQEPILGEELFAAGAYMGAGPAHQASMQTQDILRWLIIASLLAGSLLKLIGLL